MEKACIDFRCADWLERTHIARMVDTSERKEALTRLWAWWMFHHLDRQALWHTPDEESQLESRYGITKIIAKNSSSMNNGWMKHTESRDLWKSVCGVW